MRLSTLTLTALALAVCAVATPAPNARQQTKGQIVQPANGAVIAPGAAFPFEYTTMADYGVSSYNYTVYLFTSPPASFSQSPDFAEGVFLGRFAEANYPGNPAPPNPPPATLTMPDFAKSPGGFGAGASGENRKFVLLVMEEYATGEGALGLRLALAMNSVVYNGTKH
ncbi:hypothetical protein MIND_00840800 [Mycena indigotica]|uniref:Uncharacterized protein n=1 Tax=Mycena indigotica TaxID=2126181 RepID=A0A8H6SH92_9AGAR|nr:uncharacterized protein MIND_00840800 [Mycena indigotica]KAF7298928.1 hypothetical protein MIND_00840800 [Mycena indigotica]